MHIMRCKASNPDDFLVRVRVSVIPWEKVISDDHQHVSPFES